jgi:hypothetical protein
MSDRVNPQFEFVRQGRCVPRGLTQRAGQVQGNYKV